MGIIIDIVLALIILINVYICYQKGLVKLAVGLLAVIVSIILSLILYKPVSNLVIEKTEIDNKIEEVIIKNFTTEQSNVKETEDNGFINYIEKYVDDAVNKTKNEIVIEAAGIISVKIINAGVILSIFIIVRIALIILTFISDIITELPIIKQCNDIGGLLYGIIKSLLIVYVLLTIVFFIVYTTGSTTISEAISSSYITKFFYNNNIILTLLF